MPCPNLKSIFAEALARPYGPSRADYLDDALGQLERLDPRAAALVKLRAFAGLTPDEAAAALGVVRRTADRDWAFARAWLFRRLAADDSRENSCRTAGPDGA